MPSRLKRSNPPCNLGSRGISVGIACLSLYGGLDRIVLSFFFFFEFLSGLFSDLRSLKMLYDVVPEEEFEIWSTSVSNKEEITVALTNGSLTCNLTCNGEVLVSNLGRNNDYHH